MTKAFYIVDIETQPADDSVLDGLIPEMSAPANYSKPEAIKKYIDGAIEAWKDKAALDAITGRIVCIGFSDNGNHRVIQGTETEMLTELFTTLTSAKESHAYGAIKIITYNGDAFDWLFIIRRAMLLGIEYPSWMRNGRYFNSIMVDLRTEWAMGDRSTSTGGLSGLARAFGIGEKLGSGKHFGKLWNEDREAALAYTLQDIALTEAIAMKMGVIQPRSQEPVIQSDETDDFDY